MGRATVRALPERRDKPFHVEMANPYCAEVSIPMMESRSVVRGFANGLLGELGLLDPEDRECDPYAIPKGFIATTIAIHLGKRIG